ncbi:MAG: transposase [bacterium]|nr:transposase [bacterium]
MPGNNEHRLVRWADRLLKHSPVGRVPDGSVVSKLRASLDQLPACRSFIARFLGDADTLLGCQEIQRIKLFSNQHFDQIEGIFDQAEFPFENTNVHLLCLAPDHIHLYIESSLDYSLDEIVNAVREYSEQEIPIQLPDLQQNSQLLWERAYSAEGIG